MTTVTTLTKIEGENAMKELEKMNTEAVPKFNVRDTKKYYSMINDAALKGREIRTYKANPGSANEVSHIATEVLDLVFDSLGFTPVVELDEEKKIYTASVEELNFYGEGKTREEAIEDYIETVIGFLPILAEKWDLYIQALPKSVMVHYLKLLRLEGDRDKIKRVLSF